MSEALLVNGEQRMSAIVRKLRFQYRFSCLSIASSLVSILAAF